MLMPTHYRNDAFIHGTKAYYLRKSDQESEMGCLALQDGDKAGAAVHFAKMEEYKQLCREIDG
jgi:hypothetical protein